VKKLMIIRHAKAVKENSSGDFYRVLRDKGEADATRLGRYMKQNGMTGCRILSSPAKRGLQTAELLARQTGETVFADSRLCFEGVEGILECIREIPIAVEEARIVGHNPDLEDLLAFLMGSEFSPVQLGTCCSVMVECEIADWHSIEPGCGRIRWMLRPGMV